MLLGRSITAAVSGSNQRNFYSWINFVFNSVDNSRVRDIGPDRAAAEWILRLGGTVKFSSREHWSDDYNQLPSGSRDVLRLEAIDASGISITSNGLQHLEGLTKLWSLNMSGCAYISDQSLPALKYVSNTLQHLDISHCEGITDQGLPNLFILNKLRLLNVTGTSSIKHRQSSLTQLKNALPNCKIIDEDN